LIIMISPQVEYHTASTLSAPFIPLGALRLERMEPIGKHRSALGAGGAEAVLRRREPTEKAVAASVSL
jgi:hypothetical protein